MIHAKSIDDLSLENSWLTIGVFDGVHRGHQEIVGALTAGARQARSPAAVVTFWPHPATVLGRGPLRCLTTDEERAQLLGSLGVDVVVTHTFGTEVAATSAKDFVARLQERLDFRHLLIGYDFALGKDREGNRGRLTEIGREFNFAVDVIPALADESGVISSTEIRKLVATGDVAEAAKLLGRPYGLAGSVVHGDSRGADLGFPTANIEYPPEKILPLNGVYACWASVDAQRHAAAVNVGVRPQFHDGVRVPLVEAHLLDFEGQIYDQDMQLEFVSRLRDERKFESVPALVEQMKRDVGAVRQMHLNN
ncbi:MAG: bifunctional riboflavin kinase/FAD synthetase [Anaerolineales bacterium]